MQDQLGARDFARLARFIHDYSGIKMPPAKRTMIEGRLRRRVRALGLTSFGAYCHFLFEEGGLEEEAVSLIDLVTTNKTDFFREPDHFTFLRDEAVPRLALEQGAGRDRPFKAWSAASSTGAEPYTIAMILADYALQKRSFRFAVTATDICTEVLEKGAAGIYSEEVIAPIPQEMRRRYLMRSKNPTHAKVRIVPELRRAVTFKRVNLMDPTYPADKDFDVIFCRNILIYFGRETQSAVIERLCRHLRSGGYLFLGHSESLTGPAFPLGQVAPSTFVRL